VFASIHRSKKGKNIVGWRWCDESENIVMHDNYDKAPFAVVIHGFLTDWPSQLVEDIKEYWNLEFVCPCLIGPLTGLK
jgi:hypothetical protein